MASDAFIKAVTGRGGTGQWGSGISDEEKERERAERARIKRASQGLKQYEDEYGDLNIGDKFLSNNGDNTYTDDSGNTYGVDDIIAGIKKNNDINSKNVPKKDKRGLLSKAYDTLNIADSGRSWNTPEPSEDNKKNSLEQYGDVARAFFPGTAKGVNTVNELVRVNRESARAILGELTGNKEAAEAAADRALDKNRSYLERGRGVLGVGGYGSFDEAKNGQSPKDMAKTIVSGGLETASEVVPGVRGAKYASSGRRLLNSGIEGGALAASGDIGSQMLDDKDGIDLKSTGLSTLFGSASGMGVHGISRKISGGKKVPDDVKFDRSITPEGLVDETADVDSLVRQLDANDLSKEVGTHRAAAENAERQIIDMQDGKFSDDLYDTKTVDGSDTTPEYIQAATEKQVKILTEKRDELSKQVSSIKDLTARESAMSNVNKLDDQIAALKSGDSSSLLVTEGSGVTRSLNLDRVREKFGGLKRELSDANENMVAAQNRGAQDLRTNTGRTAGEIDTEINGIANGKIPDDVKVPSERIEIAPQIVANGTFGDEITSTADELSNAVMEQQRILDELMTPQRFEAEMKISDDAYRAKASEISTMPEPRQEVELAKLNDEYTAKLDDMQQRRDADAPTVEKSLETLSLLKEKEDQLVALTNQMMVENPIKHGRVNPEALSNKVSNLEAERQTAELISPISKDNGALVASVDNGIAPSESLNPRVQEAVDKSIESAVETAPGVVSKIVGYPREVIKRWGKVGETISGILVRATDNVAIDDHKTAIAIRRWSKEAGGKSGMETIARALDGDSKAISALNSKQRVVYGEIKQHFKDYAEALGLPESRRIAEYLPHIMNNKPLSEIDAAITQLATGTDLKGVPLTQEAVQELEKVVKGMDYETMMMVKRHSVYKIKKNGFIEKRKGADGYSFDLPDILMAYTHAANNTLYIKPALEKVKPLSENLNLAQNEYLNSVIKAIKGELTSDIDESLNRTFGAVFKGNKNAYTHASATTRKLIYDATLGLNPGSAIRNLSQGSNTYAKVGEKNFLKGMWHAYRAFSSNSAEYRELLESGALTNKFSDMLRQGKGGELRSRADDVIWSLFSSVEKINRGTAYFAGKQRYLDNWAKKNTPKGGAAPSPSEAVIRQAQKAGREMSRNTQFEFGVMDIPLGLTSDTAKNIVQLQSFNIAQAKFLGKMVYGDEMSMIKRVNGKLTIDRASAASGVTQMARYAGAQMAFIFTIGTLIGMKPTDMVPFYDNATEGDIPMSPIGKLLVGDKSSAGITDVATGGLEDLGSNTKSLGGTAFGLLVPGGSQMKKSYGGIKSVDEGEVSNPAGNIRFEQNTDISSSIKASMFGKYNTNAGQQWLRDGMQTYSKRESQKIREANTEKDKQILQELYKLPNNKKSARDDIVDTYQKRGDNTARRKTDEYNESVRQQIAEFRRKYPGPLSAEVAKELNGRMINYSKLEK